MEKLRDIPLCVVASLLFALCFLRASWRSGWCFTGDAGLLTSEICGRGCGVASHTPFDNDG